MTDALRLPHPSELCWLGPVDVPTKYPDRLAAALEDLDEVWVTDATDAGAADGPRFVITLGRSRDESLSLAEMLDEGLPETPDEAAILDSLGRFWSGAGFQGDPEIGVRPINHASAMSLLRRYTRALYRNFARDDVLAACERFWRRYGGRRPLSSPDTPHLARLSW